MNNTQLYFAIGVPTFTVIIGMLLNLHHTRRLEDRMDRFEDRMNAQGESIRGEIAALRDMLIGKVIEHGERIAKLEPK